MGAAYNLFLKVVEDETLNNWFEVFEILGTYYNSYSNNVNIIHLASGGIKNDRTLRTLES